MGNENPVILGIDSGTTQMKAALVDLQGNTIGMVNIPTVVEKPFEGACETDMTVLWQSLCGLILQLKAQHPDAFARLVGVGITAQGDGAWCIDKDGAPVRKAILWNDTRAKSLNISKWTDIGAYLSQNCATALIEGAFLVIMRWLKENEPASYAKTTAVLHCKDWLNFKLTGAIATDYSDASTAAVNVFEKKYLLDVFDKMQIPEVKAMLPPLHASSDIIGHITPQAAAACGLPVGIPVVAGAIDLAGVALGAGVIQTGDGCVIYGTTLCSELIIAKEQVDHRDTNGSVLCSVIPDRYQRVMAALSGCATTDWAKDIFAPDLTFPQMEAEVAKVPVGAGGILCHPYLYGERSPFKNPFACGGFYGVTSKHGRFELLRAVFEGFALTIKDCFAALPQTQGNICVSGGGAVSDFVCQLTADVLGKTVVRQKSKQHGIYGAYTMVKIALYGLDSVQENKIEVGATFTPDLSKLPAYNTLYQRFLALRSGMEDYWQQRSNPL